jgi:uncharacterized caspase-like protein
MKNFLQSLLQSLAAALAVIAFVFWLSFPRADAAASERRLALVIGNASYKAEILPNPVNDAALVAQALQAAGFEIMGARDLDENLLREAFREFVEKIKSAGSETVAVVYFAGYGLQFEGENYLIPTDAEISEASEIPDRAVRLSEQIRSLAAVHLKASFIILDMARAGRVVLPDAAGGLAWVEPDANMLIAFNAAPGTAAPDGGDGYGPYAKALAEMIREGDLTPKQLFDRVRLRVNEMTKGAQVPWDNSKIVTGFRFLERAADAPPRPDSPERTFGMRFQPMLRIGVRNAYMVSLSRDTLDAYTDFLADYWRDPLRRRVEALLAARREAITWRRTYQANVPEAYWSYLERYPRGPHVTDAGRLLKRLGFSIVPPSNFARMDYDVPSPSSDELDYVQRAVLVFDDPAFAFELPQETPSDFLAKMPREFLDLRRAAAPPQPHRLPALEFMPLPNFVHIPAGVAQSEAQFLAGIEDHRNVRSEKSSGTYSDERTITSSISSAKAEQTDPKGDVSLAEAIAVKTIPPDSPNSAPAAAPEPIKSPSASLLKTAAAKFEESVGNEAQTNSSARSSDAVPRVESANMLLTSMALPGTWISDVLLWRSTDSPVPPFRSFAISPSQNVRFQSPNAAGEWPTTASILASIPPAMISPPSLIGPLFEPSNDHLLLSGLNLAAAPVPLSEATGSIGQARPDTWHQQMTLMPIGRSGTLARSGTRSPRRAPSSGESPTEDTRAPARSAPRSTHPKVKPIASAFGSPPR